MRKASDEIRKAALASGVPQKEIGQRVGLSESGISRFLAGRSWLSERTFDALVEVLGLQIVIRKGRKDG